MTTMRAMSRAMVEHVRIGRMKRVARKHYEAHRAVAANYSCGLSLAGYISRNLVYHANRFNAAMAVLERLDPACPKGKRL